MQHSISLPQMLALAAAAYMLLALYQPWRLLAGLPVIDTCSARVTIIIPVLNEASSIVATLEQLRQLQPAAAELIVVDGGSTDGTAKLVRKSGLADKVLSSGRGRAVQMNAGAAAATGDLLCFLHADTQPPADLVAVMRQELRDPQTVLAGFVPSIEVPGRRRWLLSFHNFISTYYAPLLFRPLSYLQGLRNLFGDQTMFCRACDFQAVGGFDDKWAIMEDTDLCVRMHEAGPCSHQHTATASVGLQQGQRPCQQQRRRAPGSSVQLWLQPRGRVKQVLHRVSRTSGRRLDAWGPLRATYIHVVIGASWYFRRDPVQLAELYNRLYTDAFR